jgi:hypothetical protein
MKNLLFWGSAALLLLAGPVWAGWPYDSYGYGGGYGYYGGCPEWGCCERPASKYDHIWDGYCQEKWCPSIDCSYSRPWWHAAPVGTGCGSSHGCADSTWDSGSSHSSAPATYAQPVSTRRPTPASTRPSDPPPAPRPPELQGTPPAPKAPADETLQLKLLPLSRPRTAQP